MLSTTLVSSSPLQCPPTTIDARENAAAAIPRRDKSLSALSHELIARYGQDGTVIDLDEVQVGPILTWAYA